MTRRVRVATTNAGKLREWTELLSELGWVAVPVGELEGCAETGATVIENARDKALAAAGAGWVLADDVALEIEALGGDPGLRLRRWAEELGGWEAARRFAVGEALGSPAVYRCGVALIDPDGAVVCAEGVVDGVVVDGHADGAGLEPCFLPLGAEHALAELVGAERARWHHRVRAWRALLEERGRQGSTRV